MKILSNGINTNKLTIIKHYKKKDLGPVSQT